jgi:hypothetical protein
MPAISQPTPAELRDALIAKGMGNFTRRFLQLAPNKWRQVAASGLETSENGSLRYSLSMHDRWRIWFGPIHRDVGA